MTLMIDVAARIIAHARRRAIPIRATASLSEDPAQVFGIAPIRVVSEQRVQAIAFGLLNRAPDSIVSWNPLNRESSSLEPFALALDGYFRAALAAGKVPRIWVPHKPALEVIDILGHRYRRNRQANENLQRMGTLCSILAEEAAYAGQQVVAVAGDLLTQHVATGQMPVEDHHLGAILAWIDPAGDPDDEARRRSLTPAAAMLDRAADDRVEELRVIAKKGGRAGDPAQRQIERILQAGARAEWDLLLEARRAFWNLELKSAPGVAKLTRASFERIAYAAENGLRSPSRPHSLSRLLDAHEFAVVSAEDVDVRSDARVRERMRRKGRVVRAGVLGIDQPSANRHPCTLRLRCMQEVVRVRPGTQLKTLDGTVEGRVIRTRHDGATGALLIELKITKGVRRGRCPVVGAALDWADTVLFEGQFLRGQVFRLTKDLAPPLVYGEELPPASPRRVKGDLLAIAEGLKRP